MGRFGVDGAVMTRPYFTLVGEHLAQTRRDHPLMSAAAAWARAMKALPSPSSVGGFTPEVMEFARKRFALGFYRQSDGSAGMLAPEGKTEVVGFPDAPVARRCGSGEGCSDPAREGGWLCARHHTTIQRAFAGAEYRGRGEHIAEASRRAAA